MITEIDRPCSDASTGSNTIAALIAPIASPATRPSTNTMRGSPRTREWVRSTTPRMISGGSDRYPASAGEGTGGDASDHRTAVKYSSPSVQASTPSPITIQAARSRGRITPRAMHRAAPIAIITR